MDAVLINTVSLALSAFTAGLLCAQWLDSIYENRRRKRLEAEQEQREWEANLESRLYKLELQHGLQDSRLDRIEKSKSEAW